MPARDAVEPAAHRKIGDWNLLLAERLYGLRRDLDVAEQGHMRDIPHPHFLDDSILFFDYQHLVLAPYAIPRRVQIQRTSIVPRGNQSSRRLSRHLS